MDPSFVIPPWILRFLVYLFLPLKSAQFPPFAFLDENPTSLKLAPPSHPLESGVKDSIDGGIVHSSVEPSLRK